MSGLSQLLNTYVNFKGLKHFKDQPLLITFAPSLLIHMWEFSLTN